MNKFHKYNVDQNKLTTKEYLLNDSNYLKFKVDWKRMEETLWDVGNFLFLDLLLVARVL